MPASYWMWPPMSTSSSAIFSWTTFVQSSSKISKDHFHRSITLKMSLMCCLGNMNWHLVYWNLTWPFTDHRKIINDIFLFFLFCWSILPWNFLHTINLKSLSYLLPDCLRCKWTAVLTTALCYCTSVQSGAAQSNKQERFRDFMSIKCYSSEHKNVFTWWFENTIIKHISRAGFYTVSWLSFSSFGLLLSWTIIENHEPRPRSTEHILGKDDRNHQLTLEIKFLALRAGQWAQHLSLHHNCQQFSTQRSTCCFHQNHPQMRRYDLWFFFFVM